MITPEFTLFEEISSKEQVLLNVLISVLAGSLAGLTPHLGAVMFWEDLRTEASPGPGATVSCADLATKVRPLFPAGVRDPGVRTVRCRPRVGRAAPGCHVGTEPLPRPVTMTGVSRLWSPVEGVHFRVTSRSS